MLGEQISLLSKIESPHLKGCRIFGVPRKGVEPKIIPVIILGSRALAKACSATRPPIECAIIKVPLPVLALTFSR